MAITTYAAIDVGSDELAMKVYELSKTNGIVELTHLRHKLSLGKEVFSKGHITYKSMSEICKVLKDFREIMEEYQVDAYQACAADALREASNKLILLDQIKLQSGIKVKILSNSEQRFLFYKAIAQKEPVFHRMIEEGTLIVDMGAGSVQFSYFNEGTLEFTQNIKLGSSRIQQLLRTMEPEIFSFEDLISDYMDKDLEEFNRMFLTKKKIHHIIAVGSWLPSLKAKIQQIQSNFNGIVTRKEFIKMKIPTHLSLMEQELLVPAFIMFQKMATLTKCDDIFMSGIDACDSIVADYAEKKVKLSSGHDFTEDIITAAKNMAARYQVNLAHVENVMYLATEIFDNIRKLHGLGKRERLLLQIGALLHSCGTYVNMAQNRENSYKIIMSTEIIGLSHKERVIVANIVRYEEYYPPLEEMGEDLSKDDYITVVKLCAILKLANVLDKSNTQKIKKVSISLRDNMLNITAHTMADITLEKGLFHAKADIFEEAFGIRPVLKRRK